jgi:hypothetical protein
MKMEQTVSETSAYKIQTPGSYPEESVQNIKHSYFAVILWNRSDILATVSDTSSISKYEFFLEG